MKADGFTQKSLGKVNFSIAAEETEFWGQSKKL